jgi:hypothetical protein
VISKNPTQKPYTTWKQELIISNIMETDNINYEPLTAFFANMASPQELAAHLDQLLYFQVYYEHKEGVQSFYELYSDVFEFKRILQDIPKPVDR